MPFFPKKRLTILDENVEAFLDGERGVENDQAEAQREHVVAGSHLKKVANGALQDAFSVIFTMRSYIIADGRMCSSPGSPGSSLLLSLTPHHNPAKELGPSRNQE